jgi:tetratricopeptide (TPR) repeat protein
MFKPIIITSLTVLLIMFNYGWSQIDTLNMTEAEENHQLCKAHFAAFDFDAAIKCGKKATEIDPTNSDYHLWLGIAYSEKTKQGWFLKKLTNAKKSKKAFEKGVELEPTSIAAREGALEYYLRAPGIAGGGVDKANKQAAEIYEIDQVRGHLANAYICRHEKDFSGAEAELMKAIKADYLPKRKRRFSELCETPMMILLPLISWDGFIIFEMSQIRPPLYSKECSSEHPMT